MGFKRGIIFLLLFLGFNYFSSAQSRVDTLLSLYGKKIAAPTLFVHYDKNIYTNNEKVWFTAYLLNAPKEDTSRSVFSVVLIRNIDSALIMEQKFIMQNRLSFGIIELPYVLSTGDYKLIAYTNDFIKGRPVADFVQEITIKSNEVQPIYLSLKLLPVNTGSNTAKVLLSASNEKKSMFSIPLDISYSYGDIKKKAKTDVSSQLLIDLPLSSHLNDPRLNVKAKMENDSSFASIAVKIKPRKAMVKFYPEGGNMVANLTNRVAFEIKDQYGSNMEARSQLYEDNKLLMEIPLASYGIGQFMLTPKKGSSYSLKLLHSELLDSVYMLPPAITESVLISVPEAVAADTLKLSIKSNTPRLVYLRLHNFKRTLALTALKIDHQKNVVIPLDDMPEGLATITILDSLERPLAERMCFLHYDSREKLTVATDSTRYGKRQKVTLTLKTDSLNSAMVSVACVQDNRIDLFKNNDISYYYYLERELGATPLLPFGKNFKNKDYIENILLVKGWRRYTWNAVLKTKPSDTLQQIDHFSIVGSVYKHNKLAGSGILVTLLRNSELNFLKTDSAGRFHPSIKDLIVKDNKKVYFYLNKEMEAANYTFKIIDDFSNYNKTIAGSYPSKDYTGPGNMQDNTQFVIQKNEKALQIKEVKITPDMPPGANACGDYVCPYNILNCPWHNAYTPGVRQPVPGHVYETYINKTSTYLTYKGCTDEVNRAINENPWINAGKEFYITDYADKDEPAFYSTLLWQYAVIVKAGEITKLSFYTGDIKGRFRVIVQGITGNDVVSGGTAFEVK